MEEKITKYSLHEVLFPRIVGIFLKDPSTQWDMLYTINAAIKSDTNLEVLLGIQMIPTGSDPKNIVNYVNVEAKGFFTVDGRLPIAKFVEDIPLITNFLATMYPYLREKVNSLYYANQVNFHLQSMNLINLVNENKQKFAVMDLRESMDLNQSV